MDKKQTYDHDSYVFWKGLHRCVRCHKQDAFTLVGHPRCGECWEIQRQNQAAYRERRRETVNARTNEWYYRMKAERRCVCCGHPVEGKYSTCAGCRARRRAAYAERSCTEGKIPKSMAVDCGVCGICNKRPATEGRRTCSVCYEHNMKNLEKANAIKNNADHPWRQMAHAEAERRAEV